MTVFEFDAYAKIRRLTRLATAAVTGLPEALILLSNSE